VTPPDLLLVGISTRALADSAFQSGFRPRTVDFYGDLDQKRLVENVALGRDLGRGYSATEAARVASLLPAKAVAYGADLENAPRAVARLARGRELLGNPPEVLRAVRDPAALFAVLERGGVPTPLTIGPESAPATGRKGRRWLRKPLRGGGGRGIAFAANPGSPAVGEIVQECLEGPTLGFSFLADGAWVRPLALSLQLEERDIFGAAPFAYCGSLSTLPAEADESSLREQALRAAGLATSAFGLRGWNGMDFVLRRGELVPLEVNPRYTSSMELWDGPETRLFAAHAEACRGRVEGDWLPRPPDVRGKAILFARRSVTVGDSSRWLEPDFLSRPTHLARAPARVPAWPTRPIADVPHPGERIQAGLPVCTLYASAESAEDCLRNLAALARGVERAVSL
jgi:predicted ATP-grasp superfamily ATP-dependent carboligase